MTKQEIKKAFDLFYLTNKVEFIKRPHGYKLNGITCAGVSTISEYRPKDYLKFWAAKEVVNFLKDKQKEIKELDKKGYEELLKTAKTNHLRKSKDALDIGSRTHDWVERYLKKEVENYTDDIKNSVEEFLKFEKSHKIEWVCVEKIVASLKYLVAGRLDSLAFVDDKLSLVDLKTSNQIDESYYLQTAGYKMCLEEMGIPIEQRIILRLPKKVEDSFEAILVDSDYEQDKKAFLNQRYSWQWNNYIDCNFKEDAFVRGYKTRKLKLKRL